MNRLIEKGKTIVLLFGAVYDLTNFLPDHPGGQQIILDYIGQDATEIFIEKGHLAKGRIIQILSNYRIGKFK